MSDTIGEPLSPPDVSVPVLLDAVMQAEMVAMRARFALNHARVAEQPDETIATLRADYMAKMQTLADARAAYEASMLVP